MARAKKPTLIDRWLATATSRGMTTHPPARKAGKRLWSLLEADLAPVRTSAAFALAQLRDPALVQAFILALKGASSKRLAKAVITLGEAGYVNAAPYLAAGFTRDDKRLSAAFARTLGMLADRSVVPLLIQALDDGFVPAEAAEALGRLGDARAAPSLLKALGHKKPKVRAAAAYALGCIGQLPANKETELLERLSRLSGDASDAVKLCAAVARFERGDADAHAAIRAALA
jgi:HEAT repeat protein